MGRIQEVNDHGWHLLAQVGGRSLATDCGGGLLLGRNRRARINSPLMSRNCIYPSLRKWFADVVKKHTFKN
jgi:hypothetical protein